MPGFFDEDEEGGVGTVPRDDEETKEPGDFAVVLLNDDFTTQDFVVNVLQVVFHKPLEEAVRIMLNVHQKGRGAAGVYPYDIAATKVRQVHALAKEHRYPLTCVIEEV
ncbi:MAG: ATP-dependent Clp protease adaptor ClpS [Treponematales bacterium]|jgi:ATP-dependent Clp protease adaptor protein ClpS